MAGLFCGWGEGGAKAKRRKAASNVFRTILVQHNWMNCQQRQGVKASDQQRDTSNVFWVAGSRLTVPKNGELFRLGVDGVEVAGRETATKISDATTPSTTAVGQGSCSRAFTRFLKGYDQTLGSIGMGFEEHLFQQTVSFIVLLLVLHFVQLVVSFGIGLQVGQRPGQSSGHGPSRNQV